MSSMNKLRFLKHKFILLIVCLLTLAALIGGYRNLTLVTISLDSTFITSYSYSDISK